MRKRLIDENHPELIKARQAVSDATLVLLDAVTELEGVIADILYQRAFDDGVAWVKSEFKRVAKTAAEVEPELNKPLELTEAEKVTQSSIVACVAANPGLRTSDITNKIIALAPVKPTPTEGAVWININRLKNEGKIENKNGRWYSSNIRRPDQQYQVMTYLPDGSKYLAADVTK